MQWRLRPVLSLLLSLLLAFPASVGIASSVNTIGVIDVTGAPIDPNFDIFIGITDDLFPSFKRTKPVETSPKPEPIADVVPELKPELEAKPDLEQAPKTEAVGECLECLNPPIPRPRPLKFNEDQVIAQNDMAPVLPADRPDNLDELRQNYTPIKPPVVTPGAYTPAGKDYLKGIDRALKNGAGLDAGKNMCFRAVKSILVKSKAITQAQYNKYFLNVVPAYAAMVQLPKMGFVNNFPKGCNKPGTIRVYRGSAQSKYDMSNPPDTLAELNKVPSEKYAKDYVRKHLGQNATAGDRYGHIEVVGSDGRFHSFYNGAISIDAPRSRFGPKRRILEGCFVKP